MSDREKPWWTTEERYTDRKDMDGDDRDEHDTPAFVRVLAARGAWDIGKRCPCGSTTNEKDCERCETFYCPSCEHWCSWHDGHANCDKCNDCCVEEHD